MTVVKRKWARSLGAGVLLSTLLATPALARRDDGDKEHRGCSKETYRIVIEREDAFRLCVFPK